MGGVIGGKITKIMGGIISNNEAHYGGGVQVNNICEISGGMISNNKATETGGGIHLTSTANLTVSGHLIIKVRKCSSHFFYILFNQSILPLKEIIEG